jgi:pyruvate formate lyase activating enzyme
MEETCVPAEKRIVSETAAYKQDRIDIHNSTGENIFITRSQSLPIVSVMTTSVRDGVVFDIKRFALDDGPGIRTTAFLKGCPLHCWWCHNPEGQSPAPELMYRKNLCVSCKECEKTCLQQALSFKEKQLRIDRDKCNRCGDCVHACPGGALTIVGKRMNVDDVVEELAKDSAFYNQSNGGITVSGGEPLMQLAFLDAILTACKKKHIHTAVDTSGYSSPSALRRIRNSTDLFLYDLKIMDDNKHRRFIGASNKRILENFQMLAEAGSRMLVRFPMIPNINDDEANIEQTAVFITSCGIDSICLLPYHRSGIEKYRSLGRKYRLERTETPSDNRINTVRKRFEAHGVSAMIGG